MELKKLAPWNWFTKEEEIDRAVPIRRQEKRDSFPERYYDPTLPIHRDFDRLFEHFLRGFGAPALSHFGSFPALGEAGLLKPKVDLSATEQEYLLTVEIPGVNEKDVSVDISGNTMTVKGEKRQEKEEKEKNYYRVERSYGSFQRVLSLPEDVNQEGIKASFKNGVLSITMPRTSQPKSDVKQIQINAEN